MILQEFPGLRGQMHEPKEDRRPSKEGADGKTEPILEGDLILQTWLSAWEGLARAEGVKVLKNFSAFYEKAFKRQRDKMAKAEAIRRRNSSTSKI